MTLELKNVAKRVGAQTHIHETNLVLPEGTLQRPSGHYALRQDDLMQLMAGIQKPTSGEVWFRGRNVTNVPVQKRNVSMVYQQFINYPNFTVYENIASPLRVSGLPESGDRVEGGQGRRTSAPVANAAAPAAMNFRAASSSAPPSRVPSSRISELILLDEPLANLDYKLREELRDELPKLFSGRKAVVVYATTEPTEALLFGGNTATLHEGRVTQFGPTSQIYRRPADLITAQVFSDPPINTAKIIKKGTRLFLATASNGRPARWRSTVPMAIIRSPSVRITSRRCAWQRSCRRSKAACW